MEAMQCWAQGGGGATSSSWRLTACMALWLIVFRVLGCTVNDPGGTQHYPPYSISVFFNLYVNHQSPAQSQIFHLDNLPQKHQQCSWSSYKNVEQIMKHFHLPLVRRWKAVTLLRVHFSKQSDSVWNSTQLPRNQLRNQQPDIFSSKLIFFSGFLKRKDFSPLAKIFHNCVG